MTKTIDSQEQVTTRVEADDSFPWFTTESARIAPAPHARGVFCEFLPAQYDRSTLTFVDFTTCEMGSVVLKKEYLSEQAEYLVELIHKYRIQTVMIKDTAEGTIVFNDLSKKLIGHMVTVALMRNKADILTVFNHN